MSPKYSNLYLTLFLLFIVHAIEESVTRFFNSDHLIGFLSTGLDLGPQLIFYTVQAIWLSLLLVAYMQNKKYSLPQWLVLLIGLVFFVELAHILPALRSLSYYPGLYTSVVIVFFGIYYWKALFVSSQSITMKSEGSE